MSAITEYFKSTKAELKQVSWPTRSTVVRYTLIVIAISVLVALVTSLFDLIFTKGLAYLINHF